MVFRSLFGQVPFYRVTGYLRPCNLSVDYSHPPPVIAASTDPGGNLQPNFAEIF